MPFSRPSGVEDPRPAAPDRSLAPAAAAPGMGAPVRVLGIGGSMRRPSTSLAALDAALDAAREAGAVVERMDVRALDLPMFEPGHDDDPPPDAARLADAVHGADALVWSSPLYHGSISGSFKNVIDWLDLMKRHDPPYLTGKAVGLISTAGGVQGLQAINTMEFIVRALRGFAVPFVLPIARAEQVFPDHGPPREDVQAQVRMFAKQVVDAARHLSPAASA